MPCSDWMSLSKRVLSFIYDWVVRTTVRAQQHGCVLGWSWSASSWVWLHFSLLYKQPREFPKFILGDFNWTMVNMSYHQSQQKYIHNPSPRQSRKRHNKRKRVSFCFVFVFLPVRLRCRNFRTTPPPVQWTSVFPFRKAHVLAAIPQLFLDGAVVLTSYLSGLSFYLSVNRVLFLTERTKDIWKLIFLFYSLTCLCLV